MDPQHAKFLTDQLTGIWEGEFPMTCAVLAAVPNDKRDYTPNAKSRTAWQLAVHLATADVWFIESITSGTFNWDPDAAAKSEKMFGTVNDVVEYYKREFPAKLKALRATAPEKLAATMDFFGMMQKPAAGFLGLANNHSVHHRGQLSAYLRSMGAKVPPLYGDSADYPMNANA
jgi:uncharacterized damage-inducible protein DinB